MTDFKLEFLQSPTGAKLAVYSMQDKGKKPKGVIHINHGMAEHAARYERFAKALSKVGYHVYAHDHRGHGKTTADDAPLGVFSNKEGWSKTIADVHAVNSHIKSKHKNLPIILFGHSMGANIGLNYCIHYSDSIDAAILCNSGVANPAILLLLTTLIKIERMFKGSDVPCMIAQKLTFEDWNKKLAPNRTGFDWLSRDEAEVDKYVADPLCGFPVSSGLWLDVLKGIADGGSIEELVKIRKSLPMFILAGQKDPATENGKAVERLSKKLQNAGIQNLETSVLTDTRHESLNEINRDETTATLIKWLNKQTS